MVFFSLVALLVSFVILNKQLLAREENVPRVPFEKNYFMPLRRLIPFVSNKQSRKNICALKPGGLIKKICNRSYDNVRPTDTAKIDELFVVLREIQDDGAATDYAKYLTTQLIFSTLPQGPQSSKKKSAVEFFQTGKLVAQAGEISYDASAGISRAQYEKQLEEDLLAVKGNCPKPGDQNWVFSAMCSEYRWVNGVEQFPIYSKQYAEKGGSCEGEAGAIEQTNIQSIVSTKMRSEYDFVDEKGVSSQIACSFTCASYQCPRYEQRERERTQWCANPITYPHFDKKWSGELTPKQKQISYETAKDECEDRQYDHVKKANGTSALKKARTCKITGSTGELYQDPPDYRPIFVDTYCCSCDRPERDPYVSIYDFTGRGYTGRDFFKKLIDSVQKKITDSKPKNPVQDAPPKISPPSTPEPPPTQPPPPSAPSLQPKLPPAPPPAEDDEKPSDLVRVRFKCAIALETYGDITYTRLQGGTTPLNDKGEDAPGIYWDIPGAVNGQANISRSCGSLEDTLPVCIDPRNKQPTGELNFIQEFSRKDQNKEKIGEALTEMFDTMWAGKRPCKASEVPQN